MITSKQENQPAIRECFSNLRGWLLDIRRGAGEFIFIAIICTLVIVTSLAAYRNIAIKGWTADAAAWAQATGSIIAIAGAAWLARSEIRHTRRWRREQGEEAAWGVRFVLSQAQFDAQIIAFELTRADPPFDALDMRSWRQLAANASLALNAMLTRGDYIHATVILTTCNAKILIDQLCVDLEKMDGIMTRGKKPDDQLVSDIAYAHINLAKLIEQYDARVRGIRQALDRGGDMLPIEEWSEWTAKSNS